MQRSNPIGIDANMRFGSSLDTELDPACVENTLGL